MMDTKAILAHASTIAQQTGVILRTNAKIKLTLVQKTICSIYYIKYHLSGHKVINGFLNQGD